MQLNKSYIEQVKEFHELFDVIDGDFKEEIPLEIRQLRVKLLFEELEELATASDAKGTFQDLCKKTLIQHISSEDGDNVNKKEEFDALCDIQYVLSGAVLSLGYKDVFNEGFSSVHESNMSKLCNNMQEVEDTIAHYKKLGVNSYYIIKGDKFKILRESDNKVLKNVYYKPFDSNKILKLSCQQKNINI